MLPWFLKLPGNSREDRIWNTVPFCRINRSPLLNWSRLVDGVAGGLLWGIFTFCPMGSCPARLNAGTLSGILPTPTPSYSALRGLLWPPSASRNLTSHLSISICYVPHPVLVTGVQRWTNHSSSKQGTKIYVMLWEIKRYKDSAMGAQRKQ